MVKESTHGATISNILINERSFLSRLLQMYKLCVDIYRGEQMGQLRKCTKELCSTCEWAGKSTGCASKGANKAGDVTSITCDYILKHGGSRLFVKDGLGAKRHEADVCDKYLKKSGRKRRTKWLDDDPIRVGSQRRSNNGDL